ncbi:hypothetical protein ACFU6S_02275 [Streptomyces sp. NPDC057456]|uniref:hypothetical protein n=1 Tax=Streptomyces sp. NPDC057456 TaxID=3346139 RepID=UPI0036B25E5D
MVTLPLAAAALVLLGVAAVLPNSGGSWTPALLGSLILGDSYSVISLLSEGFGFGDVKLALALWRTRHGRRCPRWVTCRSSEAGSSAHCRA